MQRTLRRVAAVGVAAIGVATAAACGLDPDRPTPAQVEAMVRADVDRSLGDALERIRANADAIDRIFQPLPLLSPEQQSALRRHPNREHVARAQSLGIPHGLDGEALDSLVREGRLVALEESGEYWVVNPVSDADARVVPDTRALLVEIGKRFHARLAGLGAPPYRIEISSALRTAADQEELRRTNANAARGVSAHEFGTTVDILYSAFAAPVTPATPEAPSVPAWLEPHLERIAARELERVAGRRSGELKAILGEVLRELQAEGKVLVTLERQQPVFHVTVARRIRTN